MNTRYPIGLTNEYGGKYGKRCNKCDILLDVSTYKGMVVVYRKQSKKASTYNCIRCLTILQNVTDDELNKFVNSLMVMS